MKPRELFLNCYAERTDGLWQAICLDLNLAAQGESFHDVREKLEAQIKEYVFDAWEGEDQEYADQLLLRRAPWRFWAKFYFHKCCWSIRKSISIDANFSFFQEKLPVNIQSGC